jgi:hypothetical protein
MSPHIGAEQMTPELKTQWIEALESGKYPKSKYYLKSSGYCCLGVLVEIAGGGFEEELVSSEFVNCEDFYPAKNQKLAGNGYLTRSGKEYFGLTEQNHTRLTMLNDSTKDFKEVIDYIKKEL